MALSYSCCRQLLRPQNFGHLRHVQHTSISWTSQLPVRVGARMGKRQGFRLWSQGFMPRRRAVEIKGVKTSTPESETPSLLKPFIYTVGVCSCSFIGAMIWNYEKMRSIFKDMKNGKSNESEQPSPKTFGFRMHLNSIWTNLTSGQKLIIGIMAANVSVFLMWRVPRLQPMMVRYFSSSARHPLTSMTLSSFSHISFIHLFVNMYVLWSFASVAVNLFGYEQFAAVYLSAGTVSSFASIACNKLLRRPLSVSVGASGAIMGLIGAVCVMYPNAQLGIAFVSDIFPHSFSADSGMKAIIAFDLLGLALGWKFLDHAGHLGGMLFGLLYTKYGSRNVWGNRETIVRWWHGVRGKP